MAEAPGRKACRCRQRGHGGGGEGGVGSGKDEVKEEKGAGSDPRLRTPPLPRAVPTLYPAGACVPTIRLGPPSWGPSAAHVSSTRSELNASC